MVNSSQVFYRRLVLPKIIFVFLILFIVSATETMIAQQTKDDTEKSTSLMLQFFGPEALGIHINHNASQRFSLNLGLGAGLDAHIGLNAYLTKRDLKRFAWYGGLQVFIIREVQLISGNLFGSMGSSTTNKRESQVGVYIPIGFEYIAKKGFTIQLDVGPNFVKDDWGQTNTASYMGSLKIGYTFKPKQ